MRKFISIFLAVCLLMTIALPAMAAEKSNTVNPRYSHIGSLDGSISVNGSGTATCFAQADSKSIAYKVQLNMQLQGFTGTNWRLCKSWSTINTYSASLSKTAATSSDFTDYRIQITCKIYDSSNTLLESVTVYKYA